MMIPRVGKRRKLLNLHLVVLPLLLLAVAGRGLPEGRSEVVENQTVKVYLAGPLFTQAEVNWNKAFAEALTKRGYSVILPQETARPFVSETGIDAKGIFNRNRDDLESADVVIAILDGADVDSGTAWEVGYAFARGKPVLGIRTDFRRGGDATDAPVNLMISESVIHIVVAAPGTSMRDLANQTDQALRGAAESP